MNRRALIAVAAMAAIDSAALGWPLRAFAQSPSDLRLVAVLWPGKQDLEEDFDAALRSGLKDGGFVEGTNFAFAMRYANGDFARLAPLAAEIAALKPSVIIAAPGEAVLAAHEAAPSVPLVNRGDDPVTLGLADSYARPGGMVTGNISSARGGEAALLGKRISLLKELVPGLSRIGLIVGAGASQSIQVLNGAKDVAHGLSIVALPLPVRTLDDVEAAFASGIRDGADAFYIDGDSPMMSNRDKVAALAAQAGKPTVSQFPEQARAGLLMAYSPDLRDAWRLTGVQAAKILAGAKPSDIPIEQASKFTFVLNMKTAKALGLTIPPTLLARADEVIE
jgi:putative ABC transport system substrate-binding protein